MFDIGFWELLVIAVLALLILGPERLPGAIRSTARTVRSIKGMANNFKTEIDEQLRIHELHNNLKKAEQQNMEDLAPALKESVEELKKAAESVQHSYKQPVQHSLQNVRARFPAMNNLIRRMTKIDDCNDRLNQATGTNDRSSST